MAPKRRSKAPKRETKKRESAEIQIRNSTDGAGVTFSSFYPDTTKENALTGELSIMPVRSFYRMSKGSRPNQMIGNEIFSKQLHLKGRIMGLPSDNSVQAYLVHGFIKSALGFNNSTTPNIGSANREAVETFIANQLTEHFNDRQDEMRYRTAKKDNIQVLGYRKLQHKTEALYQDDIKFDVSWPQNRKVVYTECAQYYASNQAPNGNNPVIITSNSNTGSQSVNITDSNHHAQLDELLGDVAQYLPLQDRKLPFALIYIPKYNDATATISVKYNDVHYFNG